MESANNTQSLLKPKGTSRVQVLQLRRFLGSSKRTNAREIFNLNDPSSFQSTIRKSAKTIEKTDKFNEILKGLPLQETRERGESIHTEIITSFRRNPSSSQWEESQIPFHKNRKNLPKITKSFLLANNNNANALRQKNEVFLGKSSYFLMDFLKCTQPETLKKALHVEKIKKYSEIQTNFSEKNLGKTKRGRLIVNTFQNKTKSKEKLVLRELKQDLIITKNQLKPSKILYF